MTVSQPMMNIGMVGHVDHGKTTLTQALTGKWTDQHSEEMKRGISIKLGYADANFYKITPRKGDSFYTSEPDNESYKDFKKDYVGSVSFVDAPGHETLMAVMLSGAAIMDYAILIIAANEKCPQPQTREHLSALEIMGLTNVLVVQNKIDICSQERAVESYKEIKDFLSKSSLSDAPIIPVSAHHNRNIDVLIEFILTHFEKSDNDVENESFKQVAREVSISESALKGGDLGWINENIISERIKSILTETPVGNLSSPIVLENGILIFKLRDKRKVEQNMSLEEIKNELINAEKSKILNMYSVSHYDKVRRTITINFFQ